MPNDNSARATNLPLAGLRVADMATGVPAMIGRCLSDLGADVLNIEPSEGASDRKSGHIAQGESLDFAFTNIGKRRTILDLDNEQDRITLDALLSDADILIENFAPGSPQSLRLAPAELRNSHPHLVIMSVSDFGRDNCLSGWKGSDAIFQALGGQLSRSGLPGRSPLLAPGNIAYQSSMIQATFAILLSYLNRLKTGLGDHLDFASVEGAAQALDPGYGIQGSATSGVPPSKLPRGRPDARYQYPIIPCSDGHVRMCVLAPRQWHGLFAWLGEPEEFADPSFDHIVTRYKSKTLIPAVARLFANKTRAQIIAEGQKHGVPIAGLSTLENALESEQAKARGTFLDVTLANGLVAPVPDGIMEVDGVRAGIRRQKNDTGNDGACWSDRSDPGPLDWAVAGSDQPLAGLRVLDLGVIVVGAEQSRLLADQGADVIKIENPRFPDGTRQTRDGGPMSPGFAAGHRNKRSLALNLREDRGRQVLLELIAKSDILLSNFKPGTLESLGLDEATLRAANPKLIMADSSAFGSSGPWSNRMGYGPLVRAEAGLTELWRYPDDPESFSDALTVYPDHVAGRINAIGALALLIRRARTGLGGRISVSQAEVMLSHLAVAIAAISLTRQGIDVHDSRPDAPRGVFRCAGDDEWCVIDVQTRDERAGLCRILGCAEDDGPEAIHDRLTTWCSVREPMAVAESLQAAGIPAAPMLRVLDMADFAYFNERRFLRPLVHPALCEEYLTENAPVRSERLPDPPDRPAPLIGEHSREIALALLDGDTAAVDTLAHANVITIGKAA